MLQFLLVHPLGFMKLWSSGTRIQNDFLAKVILHTVFNYLTHQQRLACVCVGGGGEGGGTA